MPENKNSFIKSKMNKDLDERLLPSNEYRDASNIAVSRSEGSDVGALESILGNTSVLTAVSNSKIIGYFVDETNNFIYYFLTDFDGNLSQRTATTNTCTINRFDINTNNNVVLVSGYFLNFSKQYHMYGISLMENLLFWTDNRNQPRKINVNTALGDPNYYTTEDQISVCKFSPYNAVDFINLRSTANPQPGTMYNEGGEVDTVNINGVEWSSANLAVTSYANGDSIPEIDNATDWAAATDGAWCYYNFDSANGSFYGKLYNKFAVDKASGLAPRGYRIAKSTDFTALSTYLNTIAPTNQDVGKKMKTKLPWPGGGEGTNDVGFAGRAGGTVNASGAFSGGPTAYTLGTWWNGDNLDYQEVHGSGADVNNLTTATGTNKEGRSIRLVKESDYDWAGDPDFLTEKFVKFSYRFKYDDNEYSVIAPFSQDVFVPQQGGLFLSGDEDAAFRTTVVEFMQNNVNSVGINIKLPSKDIITDYKVKEIDIVFKESDGLAYQVLETIDVNKEFIDDLNNTNIFQYNYQSTIPYKTLPQSETTRVYDKVPVRALAQESSGNRVIYGNFIQSYSAPLGLSYYVDVAEKSTQTYNEYRNHSIKQNRNYQVGLILADKYGRETDVVLSSYDNILNASGNPQQGSNLFNKYKGSAFVSSTEAWKGDNLKLEFNNMIPEGNNANGVSGFPGSYAEGKYYKVDSTQTGSPFFRSDSNDSEASSSNTDVQFDFQQINYTDAVNANNLLNIYVNDGINGSVKQLATTYVASSNVNTLRIDFGASSPYSSGVPSGYVVEAELLYNKTDYQYSFRKLGMTTDAELKTYFDVGRYLRGFTSDYAKVVYYNFVNTVDVQVTFRTNHQISSTYLFTGAPGADKMYATYDINPNGFYTYRVAVKQQQQEYYNVYLPGVVDGYPIEANTSERGETAFITLIADNINKVPRDLQEVGPLDDQFNSDTRMWGRVTNITADNEQYFPSTNSDRVDLIGTVTDIFPTKTAGTTAGDINEFAIFDYISRPNLGKVATQAAIGLYETSYTDNSPNPPANMKLAVYETAPVVSALELFWETSTAELISDLNYDIINATDEITGSTIEAAAGGFDEADASGTVITEDFKPTVKGETIATATAILLSVNSKYENGILNPNNRASEFILESGSAAGSHKISTASTFYAGEDNATANYFEFTIQYTINDPGDDTDGVIVNQNYNATLGNVDPIITNSGVISVANGTNVEIFNSITTATGLTGVNGSADLCSRFLFPRQTGAGWSFTSLTLPSSAVVTTDLDSYFIITKQASKNVSNPCDPSAVTAYGLVVKSAPEQTLKAGEQYLLTFVLTDALGSTDTEVVTVNVT